MIKQASPLLRMSGIKKSFDGVPVLKGIDLELAFGAVKGFVGGNGSGKSTTMNILGGVLKADAGRMELAGAPYDPAGPTDARTAGISFIHQELNLFPNLSVAENLSLEDYPRIGGQMGVIDWRAVRSRAGAALRSVGLSISPDVEVSSLTPGEQQLVEIAKALTADPKLIILDEPTTSLTSREIDRLFGIVRELRSRNIGIIYISHALADVREICDEIIVLREGVVTDEGDVHSMVTDRIVAGMVGRSLEQVFPRRRAPEARDTPPRLSVKGLSKRGTAKDIGFDIAPGEILGLCGLMGSGRTEVARMVFGLDGYDSGTVAVDGIPLRPRNPREAIKRGIAFLTEDRRVEGVHLQQSIVWNIPLVRLSKEGRALAWLDPSRLAAEASEIARRTNVKAASLEALVSTLSGGNQQKVVIAKWLTLSPSILILDEPTRGIDIGAKVEIYALIAELAEQGMSVLLISSENEELLGLSDRVVVLEQGEVREVIHRADDRFTEAGLTIASSAGGSGR